MSNALMFSGIHNINGNGCPFDIFNRIESTSTEVPNITPTECFRNSLRQ